ncbi:mavicyanin-like, partial [Thalictrum thalictroides]
MASNNLFVVIIAIVAIFLPSIALAKLFVVGDETGWTIGFDYQGWANGKEFHVGDQL